MMGVPGTTKTTVTQNFHRIKSKHLNREPIFPLEITMGFLDKIKGLFGKSGAENAAPDDKAEEPEE